MLNPDEVAKTYFTTRPGTTIDEADAYAANAVPASVTQCIEQRQSVAVETVLSSDKYESTIVFAHKRGYQVGMIYLALESAAVSKARVEKRVASGGHPAPKAKLQDRWLRSLDRLVKFAPLMDGLLLYLSTAGGLMLLAEKHHGKVLWYGGSAFPQLKARLGAHDAPEPGPETGGISLRGLRMVRKLGRKPR